MLWGVDAFARLEDQVAFCLVGVAGRVGEAALVRAVDLVGQDVQQHLRTDEQGSEQGS